MKIMNFEFLKDLINKNKDFDEPIVIPLDLIPYYQKEDKMDNLKDSLKQFCESNKNKSKENGINENNLKNDLKDLSDFDIKLLHRLEEEIWKNRRKR
jgi:hypothetical protein